MKRRLVTLAAAASLLLCVATVALWVRSYVRSDAAIYFANSRRAWSVQSVRGHLDFTGWTSDEPQQVPGFAKPGLERKSASANYATAEEWGRGLDPSRDLTSAWFMGFGFLSYDIFPENRVRAIGIPHWFLALLLAMPSAVRLFAAIRARKESVDGLCASCGYDLRATPGRCPECGCAGREGTLQSRRAPADGAGSG
jgi:hypothetical protein